MSVNHCFHLLDVFLLYVLTLCAAAVFTMHHLQDCPQLQTTVTDSSVSPPGLFLYKPFALHRTQSPP